jgi:sugar O-acyltransferase (sialic acid O-acetyltransferase NeuD family)
MANRIRTVMIGTGRHAEVLVDCLHKRTDVVLNCALDQQSERWGKPWLGVPVIGSDDKLKKLPATGVTHFVLGVGGVGDNSARIRLYKLALTAGLQPLDVIHPSAIVSQTARLGKGVQLLAGSIINTGAVLGNNVLVNTGAIVEHHCTVEDHVHIASGATLGGTVSIGYAAHIGAGAVVRQGLAIGEKSIVGAGAVVVKSVGSDETVVGVPASPLTKKKTARRTARKPAKS